MNYRISLWLVALFFAILPNTADAVVAIKNDAVDQQIKSPNENVALNQPLTKKEKRFKKRIERIKKRFIKKNNSFGDVLNSKRFQLGALLLLIGISLAVVVNILSLAQVLGWLAGMTALAGLVLMIWSLIEYS